MHSPGSPCDKIRANLASRLHEPCEAEERHLRACSTCREWLEQRRAAAEAIRSLPRLSAPAQLSELVRNQLAGLIPEKEPGSDPRVASALRALAPRPVPAILDDLVLDLCPADSTRLAGELRRMHRARAPRVLERLVDEELRSPASHRARRFAGDLDRLTAPADLEERVRRVQERQASRWPWTAASLAGIAAATLLFWLVVRPAGNDPVLETAYRFRVVRASSLAELGPYAQWFADGLTGGGLGAVDGAGEGEAR